MNELPNQSELPPEQPSAHPAPPAQAAESYRPRAPERRAGPDLGERLTRPLPLAVIALAVLLAAQTWSSHSRINTLRQEMARSLQKGNQTAAETASLARDIAEQSKALQLKVGVLESRQLENQSQQLALEQLYADLSKSRDEWALSEVEQVLSTASQQLQLAGNVQGALLALQNADRSLARSDKPQFIIVRRAIAADLEKLKATPAVDLAGVALRLDSVIAQVDTLPLLSDEKPLLPAAPVRAQRGQPAPATAVAAPEATMGIGARMLATWREWSEEMWDDVRQLIRVRSVNTPEALMLSPDQNYFVRENLKLRLLNARLALLSRDETTFAGDLAAAQQTLDKYFDTRARTTQQAQAALRQVQANNLAIEMPTLADSLNAVRNYKKP
ncbi:MULTISPECIES: uroporphyrinogen-III C-methyltransferase [unclassified Massilia]|uniref:uroporphyrinogen-III C-methyltransferase n=1 Tax=unclassified Massilia TaxID=2609279 RepID=UPI001783B820|nr:MULTISPECIES: uroporphyrinogen-III C-methyltransferase [unclassified Massilia]MBD8532164.1 uroporphyrinogen-III C-methyltransferase [Massilia sp. CFBP 13647]MBD8675578.1 uroporphyrinogen-III C-methyltransferase [Massilia sp. CFBP 13721]